MADQPRTERRDRHVRAKVVVVSGSFENWCPQTEPSRSLLQLRGPERLKLEDARNYAPEAIAVKGNLGVSESRSRPKRPLDIDSQLLAEIHASPDSRHWPPRAGPRLSLDRDEHVPRDEDDYWPENAEKEAKEPH